LRAPAAGDGARARLREPARCRPCRPGGVPRSADGAGRQGRVLQGAVHPRAGRSLSQGCCPAARRGPRAWRVDHALMAEHKNPLPTTDAIIAGPDRRVVLILRKNEPRGWALPGGFVDYGEELGHACRREAREETGLEIELAEQLC